MNSQDAGRDAGDGANEASAAGREGMFEWAFNHSAVPKSITRPTGEVRVNDAFCKMLGYTREELGDETTWAQLTHQDDIAETQQQMDALISGQRDSAHYEKRFMRKDGSIVWVDLQTSLRRDAAGQPLYLATTMLDITESKAAEEILRENEERYRELFEASADGIAVTDLQGHYVSCNSAYLDLLGYSSIDQLSSKSYEDLTPSEYHALEARMVTEQTLVRGFCDEYEKEYTRSDGSRVPVSLRAWLSRDAHGQPFGMWVIVRDITERKAAADALAREEALYRATFDHASVGIAHVGPDGRWLRVNQRLCDMLGYTREEMSTLTFADITHPDDVERSVRVLEPMRAGSQDTYLTEKRYLRKDGSVIWVSLNVAAVRNENGSLDYQVSIISDITDRKRAEETLRDSDARLRLALGAARAGVWEWDVSTDENRWSDELWDLYGLDRQHFDASFGSWLQSIRPEDRDRLGADVSESSRLGEQISIEWRVNDDGDCPPRWLLSQGQPFKNESGVVEKYRGIVLDISERRQSEQDLHALLDNAPYGAHMYELSEDGRLVLIGANRKAEEVLDLDHTPLLGKTLEEAFPGNAGTETAAAYHRVAAEGGTWETEQYAYDAGGIAGVFEVYAFSFGPRRMAVFFRDITEKRKLEEELLRTSQTLQAAMDNSPAGIAIADAPDGKLRYVNDAGLLIRGGDRQSLMDGVGIDAYVDSWNLLDLDGSPLKADEVPLARAIMLGETSSGEFVIQRAVGDERTVVANAAPIRNDSGEVISGIVVFTDITELKAAEERVRRLNRVYTLLSNVNQALVHLREPQQIFEKACRAIVEDGGFKMSWVGLVADDGVSVRPVASDGATDGYLESLAIAIGEKTTGGPVATAIEQRCHIVLGDVEQEPTSSRWRRNMLSQAYRSAAVFPLIVADKAVGAFSIYSEEPGFFDDDQIKLLDELADDISFSLLVAEREAQRVHAEERVARSLTSIIEVVSLVSEQRDPYTAGHQRRVSQLATSIAAKMGMSDAEVDEIRTAGLLHDLGKMSIPAEILSKPSRLTDIEFQLIKEHSESGYKIIAGAHLEGSVAEVVYQHHERCDGSGYPRGLSRDELLPGAKVIAVADVVEAMMSHRPYRPGLGLDAALEEIEAGAGSRYDAETVNECVALFREEGFEFAE